MFFLISILQNLDVNIYPLAHVNDVVTAFKICHLPTSLDSSENSANHTIPAGAGEIKVKKSEAYGALNCDAITTTDEDFYSYPHGHEEQVNTTANDCYNYPAKFDPIEAKPNESYAMSITTEKNEAYKPVGGACDEYDYI